MRTHVINGDVGPDDAPVHTVTMYCGAQAVIFASGDITPPGFDFYDLPERRRANCGACSTLAGRDAVRRSVATVLG